MSAFRIDPQHTALLVMDYQSSVLGSLSSSDTLLERVRRAIAIVRGRGGHVAYVRIGFEPDDITAIPPQSRLAAMADRLPGLHPDSPVTRVADSLAPELGDIVVRKTRIGAFSTTDLDARLREHGITTLVLSGVTTSGVVLSTVRDAHDRDYHVIVLEDATADPDAEVHDFLMRRLLPQHADVMTIDGLDAALRAAEVQR